MFIAVSTVQRKRSRAGSRSSGFEPSSLGRQREPAHDGGGNAVELAHDGLGRAGQLVGHGEDRRLQRAAGRIALAEIAAQRREPGERRSPRW